MSEPNRKKQQQKHAEQSRDQIEWNNCNLGIDFDTPPCSCRRTTTEAK